MKYFKVTSTVTHRYLVCAEDEDKAVEIVQDHWGLDGDIGVEGVITKTFVNEDIEVDGECSEESAMTLIP